MYGVMVADGGVRRRRRSAMDLPADVWVSIVANMHPDQRVDDMAKLHAGASSPSNLLQAFDTYLDIEQHRQQFSAPNPFGIPLSVTHPGLDRALSSRTHAKSHLTNTDVMNCCVEHTVIATLETQAIRYRLDELCQDVSQQLFDDLMAAGVDVLDANQAFMEPVHIAIYVQFAADQGEGVTPVSRYLYNLSVRVSQSSSEWLDMTMTAEKSLYIPRHPLNLMANVRQQLQRTPDYCVSVEFDTVPGQGSDDYDSSTVEVHYVPASVTEPIMTQWAGGTKRKLMF